MQPCHSQRSRSLAEAWSAGEPPHRLAAARDGPVVVVGEGDQRVQQQVGGGRLGIRWARRGAGGLRDLGDPDAAVESGSEHRRGERVHIRLTRDRDVQRLEAAGGGQQERGRVGAPAGDERQLGLQQVDLRALELFERPRFRDGQQAASRGERAGLDTGLSGRERTFTAARRVGRQRDGALQERRRGGGATAGLRPGSRPLELGGDVLVRPVCRQRPVPGAAIGV